MLKARIPTVGLFVKFLSDYIITVRYPAKKHKLKIPFKKPQSREEEQK
jgi:hypothetical protein